MSSHPLFSRAVVLGVGFVGLPLALALAKKYRVVGYDIKAKRIEELKKCVDTNREVSSSALEEFSLSGGKWTDSPEDLENIVCESSIYFLVIPTPVDAENNPDLTALFSATLSLGRCLLAGDLVVVESSVAPYTTRKIASMLAEISGLESGEQFSVAHCPERINPGDHDHGVLHNSRAIAGIDAKSLNLAASVYRSVINGSVTEFESIESVELSKLLENAQRFLNISLFNGLYRLCSKTNIDFNQAIEAASTKWNFVKYYPGLVGGHCLGIDTQYLNDFSIQNGIEFDLLTAAGGENSKIVDFICGRVSAMREIESDAGRDPYRLLLVGMSYKTNVPDMRNSIAVRLADKLAAQGFQVSVYDQIVAKESINECLTNEVKVLDSLDHVKADKILVLALHDERKDEIVSALERIAGGDEGRKIYYFGNVKGHVSNRFAPI